MSDIAASEQDLAKVLGDTAGIADMPSGISSDVQTSSGLSFEETATAPTELPPIVPPGSPIAPIADEPVIQPLTPVAGETVIQPLTPSFDPPVPPVPSTLPVPDEPVITPAASPISPAVNDELTTIKKDALNELRPLVDKLNVSAEEKFDTYLLLIRSTDDASLLAPAHDAAKAIADETRRAEALLDIIKEVDFLSQNNKAA